MSMITIFFKQDTKSKSFATHPCPTRDAVRSMALKALGDPSSLDGFSFVLGCKQLNLEDDEAFEAVRPLITNSCTIFILMRLRGGGFIEPSLLWDILLSELNTLLDQAPTSMQECIICMDEPEPCIKVCCGYLCREHVRHNFTTHDTKFVCYPCAKLVDLGTELGSASFSAAIKQFTETQQLLKHINCQVCRCGHFMINETLYAKQQCHQCQRTFCFFCNRDWQPAGMCNLRYHCSDACDYKSKLSYELVELVFNTSIQIPNRRCCPFCFYQGGYGQKCKYHTCEGCNKSFCFICLKEQEECKRIYNSGFNRTCSDAVVTQRFEDFPHLPC